MIINKKQLHKSTAPRKRPAAATGAALAAALHAHGMRVTPQKLAVFRLLQVENYHPTPDMIYAELREQYPMISLGTVYQILEQFSQVGVVRKIFSGGNRQRFDGNREPHAHFVCERCGRIDDLEDRFVRTFHERFERKYDFHIRHHYFEFRGLCAACHRRRRKRLE